MTVRKADESFDSAEAIAAISEIRTLFGAPSISCGVLHHGEVIFTYGEGYADMEAELVPNADTVYLVASNTKAFITALCGILADESILSWSQPVASYLPEFHTVHDPEISKRATLVDLCSHGTGLAPLDHAGCGFHDEFWTSGKLGVSVASNLPIAYDFRSHWLYNNFMLDVVGDLISKLMKKRSGIVLRERIFEPLGMKRTFTRNDEYLNDTNSATGYAALDDGTLLRLEPAQLEDCGLQGASGYVRSTVNDMLTWAQAVMNAEHAESHIGQACTMDATRGPLRNISFARSAQRPMVPGEGHFENSYGLGWFRHMLPSTYLGSIGPNFALLPEPPVINQSGPPRLTIAHWGEFGGFLSSFYTFPDTNSAIIVMANCSPGLGDPTDLIAQALIQNLFKMRPRVRLQEFAAQAVQTSKLLWHALVEEWVQKRVQNTRPAPLEELIGVYVNSGLEMSIEVFSLAAKEVKPGRTPELLGFRVNSLPKQTARLRHYHYDTWTFLPDSRDDAVRKGMGAFLRLPMLLMNFLRDADGRVSNLEWDLQGGACEGPAPGLEHCVKPVQFCKVKKAASTLAGLHSGSVPGS